MPRHGPHLFEKVSFVTAVADLGCGVGYFQIALKEPGRHALHTPRPTSR